MHAVRREGLTFFSARNADVGKIVAFKAPARRSDDEETTTGAIGTDLKIANPNRYKRNLFCGFLPISNETKSYPLVCEWMLLS